MIKKLNENFIPLFKRITAEEASEKIKRYPKIQITNDEINRMRHNLPYFIKETVTIRENGFVVSFNDKMRFVSMESVLSMHIRKLKGDWFLVHKLRTTIANGKPFIDEYILCDEMEGFIDYIKRMF